jgi:hypothetical protein
VVRINAFLAVIYTDKLLLCAGKLVKSRRSYICQCTVYFILKAKTKHESTGKYDLIIKCKIYDIKEVENFKYLRSKMPLGNIIIIARNCQSVSLLHTFISCSILS